MANAPQPLVLTIPEVARALKVRDAVAYGLVDTGELPAVHIWSGGQAVVPVTAIQQYLDRLVAAAASPSSWPTSAGDGAGTSETTTGPRNTTKPRRAGQGSVNTNRGRGRSTPAAHAGRTEQ